MYVKIVETKHACPTWFKGHICNAGTPSSRNGKMPGWEGAWMTGPSRLFDGKIMCCIQFQNGRKMPEMLKGVLGCTPLFISFDLLKYK